MRRSNVKRVAAALALGVSTSSCGFELTVPPKRPGDADVLDAGVGVPRGPNAVFRGCFAGPVTQPPNTPPITIILIAGINPPGTQLMGCGILQGDPNSASSVTGALRADDLGTADVTFMRVDGVQVDVEVRHNGNGGTPTQISLRGNGVVFEAPNLGRCTNPQPTCASLGITP